MENEYTGLINFWAGAAMFALIASAICLFFFRYYSGKKNTEEFNKIKSKVELEVDKTISEIQSTRVEFKTKIENESDFIITELKETANKANEALENVITESNNTTAQIQSELTDFSNAAQNELSRIANPLGKDFKFTSIGFDLDIGVVPELDEQSNVDRKKVMEIAAKDLKDGNKFYKSTWLISEPKLPKRLINNIRNAGFYEIIIFEKWQNNVKDIMHLDKILTLRVNSDIKTNISVSRVKPVYNQKERYNISNGLRVSSVFTDKHKEVYSKLDICSKFAIIKVYKPIYPQLQISDFEFNDNLDNHFRFIPISNVNLIDGTKPLKMERETSLQYTLGRIICLSP